MTGPKKSPAVLNDWTQSLGRFRRGRPGLGAMDPPNADDGANAAPKKPVAAGELEVNAWLQKMEAKEQWF